MIVHIDLQRSSDAPHACISVKQLVVANVDWVSHSSWGIATCRVSGTFQCVSRPRHYLCCTACSQVHHRCTWPQTFRGGLQRSNCVTADGARLSICSDSNWTLSSTACKSHSGNVMNRDMVAWFTYKQPVVAVSSMDAGCIDSSDAFKDGLGLYYSLGEYRLTFQCMHTCTTRMPGTQHTILLRII